MFNIFTEVLLICIGLQFLAWLWQIKTKNADVVDITWSLGIVICSLYYYFSFDQSQSASLLMLIFPALWYLRLGLHLIVRYKEQHEDSRYAYLRKHWQQNTQFKFFLFFQF